MIEFIVSFIVLSFLGLVNSVHLVLQHYSEKPMVCLIGGDGCNVVMESKWSNVFGIRNDVLGVLYYLLLFVLLIASLNNYILVISGLAVLVSGFLTLIQIYKIKSYCFYCMVSAVINVLIFVNAFGL